MRLLIIFIAFVLAVGAGLAFWMMNKPEEQAPVIMVETPQPTEVQVEEIQILVARQDIPIGKRITENDVDRQPWPKHLFIDEFIREVEADSVIDMVTRTPFKKREPLALSRLANPNDPGFLAAQLPAGKRAVTVPIDAITGVGGFVFPGDRVDVMVTHNVTLEQDYKTSSDIGSQVTDSDIQEKPTSVQRLPLEGKHKVPLLMTQSKLQGRPMLPVTEVLLSNVKVLAVGQQSFQYENVERVPTNVTLEVDELEAQRLRHADDGTLSLALRSLQDSPHDKKTPRPVGNSDMSRLTPPAYFPYIYDGAEYDVQEVDLQLVDYGSQEDKDPVSGEESSITVIRGVEKETVGVQ